MKNQQISRPVLALNQLSHDYPGIWSHVNKLHQIAHADGPSSCPDRCYLPLGAAGAAIAFSSLERKGTIEMLDATLEMSRVAALAAWRMTKGIYRVDPDVLAALQTSTIDTSIPCSAFETLPEWCCYIETPNFEWVGMPLHGMWVHLECAEGHEPLELRFLLDTDAGLVSEALHLGPWSLYEGVARASQLSTPDGQAMPEALRYLFDSLRTAGLHGLVSIVLYLCTQAGEIKNAHANGISPCNPKPKKVKGGPRLFALDRVQTWDVGVRIGAKLRLARVPSAQSECPSGRLVRAHVRRAHWHIVRSGPMINQMRERIPPEQRKSELRWMPPMLINADYLNEELPATIREVD